MNDWVLAGRARVTVLCTKDPWFGVTYRDPPSKANAASSATVIIREEFWLRARDLNVWAVATQFQIGGEFAGATHYGSGHINRNYYAVAFHKAQRNEMDA